MFKKVFFEAMIQVTLILTVGLIGAITLYGLRQVGLPLKDDSFLWFVLCILVATPAVISIRERRREKKSWQRVRVTKTYANTLEHACRFGITGVQYEEICQWITNHKDRMELATLQTTAQ